MLGMIRFYKSRISPDLPPACRFTPTGSVYAMEAIEAYGAVRGGCKAFCRILRCNPFCRGGYDPVPEDPLNTLRRE